MRLADPQARIRKLLVSWTKRTAHALRLSSFVFGLRDPEEECTHLRRTWHARLTLKRASIEEDEQEDVDVALVSAREVTFRRDGGFARVPAVDTVKVAPKRPMIVAVTEEGHALTDTGSAVIAAQLVEMATTRSGDAYRVVSLPSASSLRPVGLTLRLLCTGLRSAQFWGQDLHVRLPDVVFGVARSLRFIRRAS